MDRLGVSVVKVSGNHLRETPSLATEVREIVAPYYLDPSALIDRELSKCSDCWLGFVDGRLHAFFMVEWDFDAHTAYLGLSGTSSKTRKSGLVQRLYGAFITEGRAWEMTHQRRLLLWGTTASPVALRVVQTMFVESSPGRNGQYSMEDAKFVHQLRRSLGLHSSVGHPFVARGMAVATRYTRDETVRNRRYALEHGVDLLEKLGVREEEGDRLIFLCRLPATDAKATTP